LPLALATAVFVALVMPLGGAAPAAWVRDHDTAVSVEISGTIAAP